MENLLLTVAKGLVNEPEKVSVTVDEPKETAQWFITSTLQRTTWEELSVSRAALQRLSVQ